MQEARRSRSPIYINTTVLESAASCPVQFYIASKAREQKPITISPIAFLAVQNAGSIR
jgi:hypothetical protein